MTSNKCPRCQLVNFPEATVCKRCDLKFSSAPQMTNNLIPCPDCGNLCSHSARACPSCGSTFQSAPVYITQAPKQKTSAVTWIVAVILLGVPALFCISLGIGGNNSVSSVEAENIPANLPADMRAKHNPEGRRSFAIGLQAMTDEKYADVKNLKVTAAGDRNSALMLVGDGMTASLCQSFASGAYGDTAAAIGFRRVGCENRVSGVDWNIPLIAPIN